MQFFTLVLLALVSFSQAAVVAERSVDASLEAASTFCQGPATLMSTEEIEGVTVQQFACDSGISVAPPPAVDTDTTSLEARQFNACTSTTPGVCQSTIPCTSTSCSGTSFSAPALSDCNYIASVATGPSTGTFFTPPGYYSLLTYNTCQFRWGNAGSITFEYAYFNFGNLGSAIYNNCVTVGGKGQGYCVSNNGLWLGAMGRP